MIPRDVQTAQDLIERAADCELCIAGETCINYDHNLAGVAKAYFAAVEENTRLRAALANSKDPCVYCQLPKEEMAKCAFGFPGCGRADDMTGCPEFGASLSEYNLRAENQHLKESIMKAKLALVEATIKDYDPQEF